MNVVSNMSNKRFLDLPKDVLWLIIRSVLCDKLYGPNALIKIAYMYRIHFCGYSRTGPTYQAFIAPVALIHPKILWLIRSKMILHNLNQWDFIQGSLNDTIVVK